MGECSVLRDGFEVVEFGDPSVLVDVPVLHYELHVLQCRDVLGGITWHRDDVCEQAGLEPSSVFDAMRSALVSVAARIAWSGVMPRSTKAHNSMAFRPCGMRAHPYRTRS